MVTELPVSEVKVLLSVDSSAPAEEPLTCVACSAPALAKAVSSVITSTPAEEASGDHASADGDIRASALLEKVGCSPAADDPSAPTEGPLHACALTCAAYNTPALAEAVPSTITSAPPFVASLPLADKMLHVPALTDGASDTPAPVEVAVPFGPAAVDQAASQAVSPSCTPNSADIVTSSSLSTSVNDTFYVCSPTAMLCSNPAFAETSSVTTPAPAERATEQVLDPTGTSDISQGASALLPVVPPPLTMCAPAGKELPASAPADTVSHTPAPAEVVFLPTPASMNRVALDAIAASPAPLPALADKAIRTPTPVEAAYRTSTPADEALEPVSDVRPDFGTAEHGAEECPSCSDIRYVHTNQLKEVPRNGIRKNTLSLEHPREYPKGCPNTT